MGAAAGNRSSNANASLNVRRGKVGVSGSGSGYLYYSPSRSESVRTTYATDNGTTRTGEISRLNQSGSGRNLGGGGFARLTLDYDPAKNHNLTVGVSSNLNRNNSESEQFTEFLFRPSSTRNQLFTRATDYRFSNLSYDMNGTYTRTFEGQPRREWSVLAQHSRSRNEQPYELAQYFGRVAVGDPTYRETSANVGRNVETTLQTDYTHPFGEKQTLETGAKAILRRVLSDYQVDTLRGFQPTFQRDNLRSRRFDYDQNVVSGYATYGFALGTKTNFRLGTRLERTDLLGRFRDTDAGRFTSSYTSLLPNASVSYARKPGQTLRLAYSRRIQRPNIYYLNPYENRVDQYNISKGNPTLDPEYADSYELSYSTFVKGSVINSSLFMRRTGNAIETVRTQRADTTVSSFANVATNASYGLSLFGSFKPKPKWELGGSATFTYVTLRSGFLNTTNEGLIYNLNVNSTYKFGTTDTDFLKGYSVQFFGGLNSSRIQLQGQSAAWNWYSVGIRKDILKEKGSITLNADNFLQARRDMNTIVNTPQFDLDSHNYIALRGIRLAFNYRFGKVETRAPRPRRSIRNDDQKQGEGGQGQQ
ncbi:outer membrane beta-barrel family protein [Hymenobacter translucens]|uniref:outer membrane beta-barrel family protein n=1 Tax=Hymenobacter translucens TaxID=2886507 RepID=UPI00374D607F